MNHSATLGLVSVVSGEKGGRKIHVLLPLDVHRKLRVKTAAEDTTIQAYVAEMIRRDVVNVHMPKKGRMGKNGGR